MSKPVVLLGGGGHSSVLIEILLILNRNIVGITDPLLPKGSLSEDRIPIIGDDQAVLDYPPDTIQLVNGVGSLPRNLLRKDLFIKFESLGYEFSKVIHPSAIISSSASLAPGVQVMAGVIIQRGVKIGHNCIINTGASLDHDCIIEAHCHIAPGVTMCGGAVVGREVHVGTAATILELVTIGSESIIGAGAVVTKNLNNRTIVYSSRGTIKSID